MKIHDPEIPYLTSINSRLSPGTKIRILGWVTESARFFQINLKLGGGPDDEIALHFNPRFPQSSGSLFAAPERPVVVRNSWTSAGWGIEERNTASTSKTSLCPFQPGKPYLLEILCERARFRISVDGQLFALFTHRLPLAYVSHIEVKGGTRISLLEIPGNDGTGKGESLSSSVESNSSNPSLNNLNVK